MPFYCNACASPYNRVLESRFKVDGTLRRRRQCEACDARFTTIELRAEDLDRLRAIEEASRAFQDLLEPLHPGAKPVWTQDRD